MKTAVRITLVMVVVLAFLSACASMKSYVSARTILNNYWESYLDRRDAMPEGPEKDAFRAKFKDTGSYSYFTEADKALDAWSGALNTDQEAVKRGVYFKVFNQILNLLIAEGIIVAN